MDPRFNQQPNQPYQPTPTPSSSPVPTQPYAQPMQPVQPTPQPYTQPTPVMPAQPAYQQTQYRVPVQPTQPMQPTPQPFAQPNAAQQPEYEGMGIENAYEGMSSQPNPYLTNVAISMNDTEPITERDPLPEPDPVAEALKAPIQAAAPVPGSIGSATITPKRTKKSQNPSQPVQPSVKKRSPVIMILIVVSIIAIIGLVIVLLMQTNPDLFNFGGGGNSSSQPSGPTAVTNSSISCERTLKSSELLNYSNATSGVETFEVLYKNDEIAKVTSGFSIQYENASNANIGSDKLRSDYVASFKKIGKETDPFKSNYQISNNVLTVTHEANGDDIDKTNMAMFRLTLAKDGTINTPIETVKSTYSKFNFTCTTE